MYAYSLSPSENEILQKVKSQFHFKKIVKRTPAILLSTAKKSIESSIHLLQDDFGSGFCIDPRGYFLTCFHCVEGKLGCKIIFPDGEIEETSVIYKEKSLDLALLKLKNTKKHKLYDYLEISNSLPPEGTKIFCIGNPCYEDLENEEENIKTDYYPFYLSFGKVIGYTKDKVLGRVKAELGPLKHSCWTYWGHSGAPIIDYSGQVIGVHNSWDDKTCIRHGLSVNTLQEFLKSIKKYII